MTTFGLVAAAVVGCTATDNQVSPTPAGASVEIATFDATGITGYDLALNRGTLVVVDGCLALDNGTVPVFPDGQAAWDGSVLHFGDMAFRVGDVVDITGSPVAGEFDPSVPAGCADMDLWGVGAMELAD